MPEWSQREAPVALAPRGARSPARRPVGRLVRRDDRVGDDLDQPRAGRALEIASGGISTTVSPSGRTIAPRSRAASVTRWPSRSAGSCSPRSIPTMNPRPRTSATSGIAATSREQLAEQPDLRLQPQQRPLALEHLEAGERRRAGERVAGEGVAVEEGAAVLGGAEEALVDALGGERRGERQVAAGEALAEAEEVGRDPLLLAGEHRPGAAEAGRDLVGDQQHVVLGRRARAPGAGTRAAGPGSRPRPGPAARRSPPRSRARAGRAPARACARRPGSTR